MLRRRLMKKSRVIPEGAVDLGLPSGTLWAKGNIVENGSTYAIAEDDDYYNSAFFSWGDIENGTFFDETRYNNGELGQGHTLTADFTSGDATYDAASAKLGSPWRIPTPDDWNELVNSCRCTWVHSGLEGYEFVGPNGNKIFLPFAGYFEGYDYKEYNGYYWSSGFDDSELARFFVIGSNYNMHVSSIYRYYGLPVRAVI